MSNDEIFAAAYREHYWAVSRYVARRLPGRADEVEEVVAEVFTVAWRRRRDLPDAPLPWLYGVARNCLANAVRGYGRRRRLVDRLGNDEAAHGRHIVDSPDAETPGAWVHEALDRLSPADQEVLRLAAWEELDAAQIAVALGCGRRAATMRLHRARGRLRAEIDRLRPAPPPRQALPEQRTCRAASQGVPFPDHPMRSGVSDGESHLQRCARPGAPQGGSDPERYGCPAAPEDVRRAEQGGCPGTLDGESHAEQCVCPAAPEDVPVPDHAVPSEVSDGGPLAGRRPGPGASADASPSGHRTPPVTPTTASASAEVGEEGAPSAFTSRAGDDAPAGQRAPGRRSSCSASVTPVGVPPRKDPRHD